MENIWPFLRLYLGLLLLNACEGYPIDSSRTSGGAAEWIYLSPVLAVAFLMVAVLLVTGCVCCRQNKGFQEFTDSTSSHSLSGAGGGYINSAASTTEFTIFPPAQNTAVASHNQPGDRSSVVRFEPLPDIKPPQVHTRRPAAFNNVVNHGLSAEDWFQDPHVNFPRQQLKYVRELGCGWFGRVVEGEAQNIVPGEKLTRVVVKILHEDATTTDQMYFLHEVKPYRDLSHPNVLRLLGRCLETDPFLVLLESCPSGDLKSFLSQNIATAEALNKQGITLRMAHNISEGLQHLHNNNFVHTDLAARNCLVTPDLTVKVGDYGTSIDIFKEDYYCAGDVALPIRWCAPETLHCTETTIETKEVTQVANVWSLGVVLWEISEFGKLPYTELSDDEVIVKVLGEASYRLPPPSLPSQHGQNMYLLMKQCWSPKSVRPALAQVCAMLNHLYSSWERYGQDGDNTSLKTDEDFERRWEMFKPNTIPKTDNHVPSKDSTPVMLSPAHLATEKPQLHLCTDTLNVDRNSTTPLTTSPQPSLASSSGGDFYLPTLHQRHKSPSLQNLHGSIEDLSERVEQVSWQRVDEQEETSSQPSSEEREKIVEEKTTLLEPDFDSWLRGVETTNEEDAKFVRKISEAIRDLDNALALEKTSSSSSEASSHCTSQQQSPAKDITNVMTEENVVLDFRLGRADSGVSSDDREMTFQPDSLQEDSYLECAKNRGTDSGTDTEDETWRRRIERGEFSEKVKEKSKSVADLMVLTHIECSDGSDSEPPSLTWSIDRSSNGRGSFRLRHGSVNKNTPMLAYSSENDIQGAVLGDDFRNTLRRLQAEVQRTVTKHILPVSDTEEQALLPSNHNRDENFLVIDASEENQKNKIGNVSKVPDECNGYGITLVDNVPQTNVIECCICSLDGKSNAKEGLQCYHSIHKEFKSDGGEENICSKKVNELQNTNSVTQPNSCQKMEDKMPALQFGISQALDVDTAIASKVLPVVDIPSDFENNVSPIPLEMPHVSNQETSKSAPALVDAMSEISLVSDLETTSQGPSIVDVTAGTKNKISPFTSEIFNVSDIKTASQGVSAVNVTSCTENKISLLKPGMSPLADIVVAEILPVDVDVSCSTENKTSTLQSEVPCASDIEATSQVLHAVNVTHSSENKTSLLKSEMSHVSDIETVSKGLPPSVDITSDTNVKTSHLLFETFPSSGTETTFKVVPLAVDETSSFKKNLYALESETCITSDFDTSKGLPIYAGVAQSNTNKTSALQHGTSTISDKETALKGPTVSVHIKSSTENQISPLESKICHASDVKAALKDLPVSVDTTNAVSKVTVIQPKTLPSSEVETVSKGLHVVDMAENKTSSLYSEVSHAPDLEAAFKGVPVVNVADNKTYPLQSEISRTSDMEITSRGLPIVESTENKASPLQSEISNAPDIQITSRGLPLVVDQAENKALSLQSEVPHASGTGTISEDLPVVESTENKVSSLQSEVPHASGTGTTSEDLPVVESTENKASSLQSEVPHASGTGTISEDLPVVQSTENKVSSLQSEVPHASGTGTISEDLPVVESTENKVSSLQSKVPHASGTGTISEDLPVVESTENKASSLQSEVTHASGTGTISEDLPVVESTENKASSLQSEVTHASGTGTISEDLPVVESTDKAFPLQSKVPHASGTGTISDDLPVAESTDKAFPLQSKVPHASGTGTISEDLPVVESTENKVSSLQSEVPHASGTGTTPEDLPVVQSTENKVSSLQSEVPHASGTGTTSEDLPVVQSTENKVSSLQSEVPHASGTGTISEDLPVVESTENKVSSLQSKVPHASGTGTISEDLPVVESTENKVSSLQSKVPHASGTGTISEDLPVVESTENKASSLQSEVTHASGTGTISEDLPVVESTENKASSLQSEVTHASGTGTISEDLPVVESTDKAFPLQSKVPHASGTGTISDDLPVAESTDKAFPLQSKVPHASGTGTISEDLPVVQSTENKVSSVQSEVPHASGTGTTSEDLPVVQSTENKVSSLQSEVPHASGTGTTSEDLPVVQSTENKVSSLQSEVPHASGTGTTSEDLPVVQSTENKVSSLQSEVPHASGTGTTSEDLPVVESTENKASSLQSEVPHASGTATISEDLPVVESTENKFSSLQSKEPHASGTGTISEDLPIVQSTENKVSSLQSKVPHASGTGTISEDLPVVESTENKVSSLQSEVPHASGTGTISEDLPVVQSTENKASSLQSEVPHSSGTGTISEDLPVVESTENKVSSLQSEVPHASGTGTISEDLPVAESTENKVSSLQSEVPHASGTGTISEDLPVVESTENKASSLQSEVPHASGTGTISEDLPVVESTESKVSSLQSEVPHASGTGTISEDLPVVESTENKVSSLQSEVPHASGTGTISEDLPVVESTENKASSLQSEVPHASGTETISKGLPVVRSSENNISPLHLDTSHVSNTETVSKGLPLVVDVTSHIENKTCTLKSEVPGASDGIITVGLPLSNSRSPDVKEGVPSVILGACEDYTLDYFQGLKSTLEEESQEPNNLILFENASNCEQHLVDFSIDSWDKHLSSAFQDHEERTDLFDVTFKENTNFFDDEDDSVVELYIAQPQGNTKVTASELSEKDKWNDTGLNQASNFLTVGLPAALTSKDVLYMEEKLKNPGLCIPSLNVIAATPVPSGRCSPETSEDPVPGEVEESASEDARNGFNKTDEKSQKECDPCFNFPIVLKDGQQNEEGDKHYLVDIVKHRSEEENVEKSKSCDKHYTSDVKNAIENNKLSGSDICVPYSTEMKTSERENKTECVQNVHKLCSSKPEDDIHNKLFPNNMQITKESKTLDTCNKNHTSHKQEVIQTKTSEQLSAVGSHSSQEDLLIAEDSVFGRPKSFVQDLFSPELMKHSEQLEFSVALSHMEGRQGPQVFGEKEANQVSAALNSWKQSGQQNRMLMEDFLLGERLASGPFEEEEMAKQSTPDDERSSDSGFRDKGSLSESCDDACDEKYHLEDIEAELEESNKSGYEQDKNVAAQDEWLDKLPAAGGKMFQDENPSVSTNSQAALSLSVDSDKDVYSDSVFTSEIEGGFGEKEADTYFSSGAVSEEQDMGNITELDDTSKSGWYLHPPVKSQELSEGSGWTSSRTSDNNGNDNSYVSFNLEEEFVTAIRNELREKLPCSALHQQQEMEEEEEEEELDEDEERRDIVIHYNTYPAPLSPILEERESVSSITTTLSDHVSPFAHSRDILKSGSDSEPLSPVFMLDPKEEVEQMDAKRFEQEIREALENYSISSEEMSSLSDENAKKSSVLFEDLEHQSREEVLVVRNTNNNNNSEDDDVLVVDTETNKATLLESPKPKSHLAFVRKALEESVATPSDDEELTVGINTDTYVISKSRFSDDSMIEKQKNTSSDDEVYTPDSISPENAVTASSLFSPDTENLSDFFLTPSEKSPSNNGDLLLHNLNNNADTGPMLDTVQELVANNEAAEIISELQNASICNNNSILLFNANNNDNIVPEMPFKRNITVEDNWLGSRVPENDNNVIISVEEVNESSNKLDRLGYLRSPNLEVPREESEERDWSLPNLDATLLSTKAPMPSPEEESWKQIPSMLAFSDLNEVMARCGNSAEEEEEEEEEDEDPYPYQVDDNDLMSTSFSVNPDEQECYTPDWESGDSEDDNNSSSSGEFIWKEGDREASVKAVDISAAAATAVSVAAKYDGLSEFPMEVIAEEDEDEEEEDDADGSSSCGSGTEFVPSAWNSEATPNRSALRSPDKRSDHKKNVSFKKQKYHCVYEYPRETSDSDSEGFDSPTRRPNWSSMSYQQPVVDYASFADWELLDADTLPADCQDTDTDPDDNPSQQQLDFYKLSSVDYDFGCGGMVSEDGEFFISSSARPFQFSGVGSNSTEVSGSQFFPGATTQVEDVSLDFITPDSGITDMNVQSGSTVEPHEEDAEVTEWEPDEDAAAVGSDEVPASPSSPMSPSGLGELRHTRDRLKLDLPTKNTAFVLDPPAVGKRRAVETVKGEASLLDSGEETEDSGIESSNGALTSSKTISLADSMKDTKV